MRRLLAGTTVILTLAGAALGQLVNLQGIMGDQAAGPQVKAAAMIDTIAIEGGKEFSLAVSLTTNPGYHIYWSNPGESGLPTTFKLALPAGFKALPMAFPVPRKFVQPGGIVGYGYTGHATFLFKITPPAGLKAGEELAPISVAATWLCCDKEKCVPGNATLSLPMKVGPASPANGELFAAARAALPDRQNPPEVKQIEANLATVRDGGPLMQSVSWNITWAGNKPPEGIDLFPPDIDGLKVDSIDVATIPGTAITRIAVRAHLMQGQKLGSDTFTALIAFNRKDGGRAGFFSTADIKPLADETPAAAVKQ